MVTGLWPASRASPLWKLHAARIRRWEMVGEGPERGVARPERPGGRDVLASRLCTGTSSRCFMRTRLPACTLSLWCAPAPWRRAAASPRAPHAAPSSSVGASWSQGLGAWWGSLDTWRLLQRGRLSAGSALPLSQSPRLPSSAVCAMSQGIWACAAPSTAPAPLWCPRSAGWASCASSRCIWAYAELSRASDLLTVLTAAALESAAGRSPAAREVWCSTAGPAAGWLSCGGAATVCWENFASLSTVRCSLLDSSSLFFRPVGRSAPACAGTSCCPATCSVHPGSLPCLGCPAPGRACSGSWLDPVCACSPGRRLCLRLPPKCCSCCACSQARKLCAMPSMWSLMLQSCAGLSRAPSSRPLAPVMQKLHSTVSGLGREARRLLVTGPPHSSHA